jgi:hypothetical protein
MERKYIAYIIIPLLISVILMTVNLYLGLIVLVIAISLGMSIFIMQDSRYHPEIVARLTDEARGVEVRNRGNDAAMHIHVSIVPLDIEFDVPDLKEEAAYTYQHGSMISTAKAVVSYENEKGEEFSKIFPLSALGVDDDDLLKPMFPLFKWK